MFPNEITARAADERRMELLRAAALDRRSRADPDQIHSRVRVFHLRRRLKQMPTCRTGGVDDIARESVP
jgi:hypothetical protein